MKKLVLVCVSSSIIIILCILCVLLLFNNKIEVDNPKEFFIAFEDNKHEEVINDVVKVGGEILKTYKNSPIIRVMINESQKNQLINNEFISDIEIVKLVIPELTIVPKIN